MSRDNIIKQLDFIKTADQLKQVIRRNYLIDGSRLENTAEHSWHAALAALLLVEYANEPVNIDKVIRMLLIHDLVEIIAGDTPMYEVDDATEQTERENEAAETLFGMLPLEQGVSFNSLWHEFEARQSPEARYAKAIDRFMPLYSNFESGGKAWYIARVSTERLRQINSIIIDGSKLLWEVGEGLIDEAISNGMVQ